MSHETSSNGCSVCGRMRVLTRGMCSKCYKDWKKWHLPPNVKCAECGRSYHRVSTETTPAYEFCSKSCYSQFRVGRQADYSRASYELRRCIACGAEFRAEGGNIKAGGGKYCSTACWGMMRRGRTIDLDYWNGIAAWRLHLKWDELVRQIIAKRGPACTLCGNRGDPCVHHRLDPNPNRDTKLLLDEDNCVVLCRGCHVRWHTQGKIAAVHDRSPRVCTVCGAEFVPAQFNRNRPQRACSRRCGVILRNCKVYGKKPEQV